MSGSGKSHSRREFITLGAASCSVLLAGCGGGGPTPIDTDDGSGNGNWNDNGNGNGVTFSVFDPLTSGASPGQRHFNPWNPTQSGCWHPGANIFDRLAVYSPTQDEVYPLIARSWEMTSDTTLEVSLSEDWTWHDGDPFVAQDWVTQAKIELELKRAGSSDTEPLMSSVAAPDDHTIEIELSSALSETFALQNTIAIYNGNLARGVFTKHDDDRWSDWLERLQDSTGDELDDVVAEITSTDYPTIQNVVGNGPFEIEAVGDTEIIMTPYEDHPNVDSIGFDRFALKLFSTNLPFQPYSTGEVDAAHSGFPISKDLRNQLPEGHTLFREGRSSNKLFAFNCGHDVSYDTPFSDPRVRKAVMHVFDRSALEPLLQGVNRPFEWPPCRVPGKVLAEGTVDVSSFTTYGQNNTERATELLEAAGYSQDNLGNWLNPEGKVFTIEVMNGANRADIGILKRSLRDFGIEVNQVNVDDATFGERRKNGEYDIMPDGSSANGITAMWAPGLVIDWLQSILHFSPEADIPLPIGDPTGSEGSKTINVEDHIRNWMSTGEERYHRELMWWWNQYLPEAENMYQPDAGAYHGSEWELDVADGIKNGVDDALYIAPKMADAGVRYKG